MTIDLKSGIARSFMNRMITRMLMKKFGNSVGVAFTKFDVKFNDDKVYLNFNGEAQMSSKDFFSAVEKGFFKN